MKRHAENTAVCFHFSLWSQEPQADQDADDISLWDTIPQNTTDRALCCFSYTGKRSSSNMLIIDVKMLSGFVPVKSSLDKVNLEEQG